MSNDSKLVSIDTSIKSLPDLSWLDAWEEEQFKKKDTCLRIDYCNAVRLGSIEHSLKSFPTLGERYPQLRIVQNSANPEDYEKNLEFWGYESLNFKKNCSVCGNLFYSKSRRRLYCSYRCSVDAGIIRRREHVKQRRNKVCLFCKTRFQAKSNKARFCSLKHRVAYFRQRKRNVPVDTQMCQISTQKASVDRGK